MGQYSKSGSYAGYDKTNNEREENDYYATPPKEVTNICEILKLNFNLDDVILDPCCGGMHMLLGIEQYQSGLQLVGNDIIKRPTAQLPDNIKYVECGDCNFLSNDNHFEADYIFLNPPFKEIIPFVTKSLQIAKKSVIMLCRLNFLETQKRYEQIFKLNPPDDVYIYIDRIACYKNGDFTIKPNSIESYAWFIWNKTEQSPPSTSTSTIHWIWSKNHKHN